jgi:hypothetical protein
MRRGASICLLLFAGCSSGTADIFDAQPSDAQPSDARPADAERADATARPDAEVFGDAELFDAPSLDAAPTDSGPRRDAELDAGPPIDSGPNDSGAFPDAGPPFGTMDNPAPSCKALLAAEPATTDGLYFIDPTAGTSTDAAEVFCDMTTSGGGWTAVGAFDELRVNLLRGANGREMFKCTNVGSEHIISPPFTEDWSWENGPARQAGGTWTVNGQAQSCGTNPEYNNVICSSRFGFGCGDGPGPLNKIFPGVLDMPVAGTCSDRTSAHTNGAFTICGTNNYRSYAVFVRSEDPAPACSNQRMDGTETDVDCGGALCAPCTACAACSLPRDCAVPYTCDRGACLFQMSAAIDWRLHCTTTNQVLSSITLPSGIYRVTAIESAVTVWNAPYSPPTTGWYYQIPCTGFDANLLRVATPGPFYATPADAWAAMTATTATTAFSGGVSDCTFHDSACADNQGILRFNLESYCP